MSLENKIENLTTVLSQILAALQQGAIVASAGAVSPVAATTAFVPAAPIYQAPVAQASIPATPAMPPAPVFAAPVAPVAPPAPAYPFHDNVTAATWAKDVWGKAAAINQEAAMQKFSALMQGMGAVDFDSLTPDKFPLLFNGIQQIKAEMGIPG